MTEAFLLILLLGAFIGFGVGRWWAERQRARADMYKAWTGRKSYRDGPFHGLF